MSSDFYRTFEEKFRGPRELVKSRLRVYLPFLRPLRGSFSTALAVDLGCGRGEWLELLYEQGFEAEGVDLDDGMLAACRDLGLKVQTGDALGYLTALPDDSQAIVSGFHLVEHIPFQVLLQLVAEALRVLKPGGLLILETPNPENIIVGATNFYIDPTHHRPIPPPLLAFIPEHVGFKRTRVLRLQEADDLRNNPTPCLLEVLNGVSPDYAVVSQKEGPIEIYRALNTPFEADCGLTLAVLAERYQQQSENRYAEGQNEFQHLRELVQHAQSLAEQAENRAQRAEARIRLELMRAEREIKQANAQAGDALARLEALTREIAAVKNNIFDVQQANDHHRLLAEQRGNEIEPMCASRSWELTAPLRWLAAQVLRRGVTSTTPPARTFTQRLICWAMAQPGLVAFVQHCVRPFPRLRGVIIRRVATGMRQGTPSPTVSMPTPTVEVAQLSPRARRIYNDLKSALARRQQEVG